MGYETSIELYRVRVQRQNRAWIAAAIKAKSTARIGHHWMFAQLRLKSDGTLSWEGTRVGKWKFLESFIGELAPSCSGGWVAFRSREGDGASWAYEFDGSGGYRECTTRRVAAIKGADTRKKRKAVDDGTQRRGRPTSKREVRLRRRAAAG